MVLCGLEELALSTVVTEEKLKSGKEILDRKLKENGKDTNSSDEESSRLFR